MKKKRYRLNGSNLKKLKSAKWIPSRAVKLREGKSFVKTFCTKKTPCFVCNIWHLYIIMNKRVLGGMMLNLPQGFHKMNQSNQTQPKAIPFPAFRFPPSYTSISLACHSGPIANSFSAWRNAASVLSAMACASTSFHSGLSSECWTLQKGSWVMVKIRLVCLFSSSIGSRNQQERKITKLVTFAILLDEDPNGECEK